ncbi:MAG TPA: hypothetical protein VIR30_18565 [Nocardioides sp.]|uniref:DUF3060 domain-containing protein n=1 Tax=Nocardioides daedukensis TaxID=634462 RepID=A0A7Y9S2W2_9ACTN|nr:hypothetical protein [Nocardioides daedukensis]NYG58475.1 hypothetical protein [Nocardioides daedukensis]
MKRILALIAALPILAALGSLGVAAPANADDRTCRGTIGRTTVDGNIHVPTGATCTLVHTNVKGNIKLSSSSTLNARGVRVDGDIQGWKTRRVDVKSSSTRHSTIEGNIQLRSSGYRGGVINQARVDGDIQLFSNRGRFSVSRNVVDGNLQCKSNYPAPTGWGNKVQGNKEGQCRRM